MSKTWSEHTADEKQAIGVALAKIYEDAGYPKELPNPKSDQQYVKILNAKQAVQEGSPFSITAKFGLAKKDLANDLETKLKGALANVSDAKVSISVSRGLGDDIGPMENVAKVFGEGELMNIDHKEGQVLWLQFWATWCPPCQPSMASKHEAILANKEKWGDNVRFVACSIDKDWDTVKKHVEAKGWTAPEHVHVRNGKCDKDKELGLQGVPFAVCIDTKGKIVYKGHPAGRKDFVQDMDDLVAGKALEGVKAGDSDEEEEEETAGGADAKGIVPEADAAGALKRFNDDAESKLMTEATQTACTGLQRAFCVLVHTETFDPKTKAFKHKMQNYHVLVGPKEKVEAAKEILKPFNDGPWEVVLREHAI